MVGRRAVVPDLFDLDGRRDVSSARREGARPGGGRAAALGPASVHQTYHTSAAARAHSSRPTTVALEIGADRRSDRRRGSRERDLAGTTSTPVLVSLRGGVHVLTPAATSSTTACLRKKSSSTRESGGGARGTLCRLLRQAGWSSGLTPAPFTQRPRDCPLRAVLSASCARLHC